MPQKWYKTKSFKKFCQGASLSEPPSFGGPQSAAPKPLPRLFLDPSYGPEVIHDFPQGLFDFILGCRQMNTEGKLGF